MSKQNSDPQSYSVDEMLEKLREGEREKESQANSELVTRPDGTQVVRVRRRKRRSEQPDKPEEPKARRSALGVFLIVTLGLVLVMGLTVVVMLARYNSKSFRVGLEDSLGGRTGATARLDGMTVTPLRASAKSVSLVWGETGPRQSLELSDLNARLRLEGFLRGRWEGAEAVARSGRLVIIGGPATALPDTAGQSVGTLAFRQYRCEFFDVFLGTPGMGSHLKSVEMALRKGPQGENQLLLRGGECLLAGWMPMTIDRGMAELGREGLNLISLRAGPKDGTGEVTFSGEEPIRSGEDANLLVQMENFPLSGMIGEEFGDLLDGAISCESGSLKLNTLSPGESELRVEFSGKSAFMEGPPFLNALRTHLGDSEFSNPHFTEVSGVFIRDGSGTRIQDLELESNYQMIIRGSLEVSPDGELGGNLEVGIAENKIMTLTSRKRSEVFSDPKGGYCWITLRLSGTLEDPMDDFQVILQEAAREAAGRRSGPEVLEESVEP